MENSVVRQTVFHGSWWAKEWQEDVKTIVQPPEERRERRTVEEECSNGGSGGLDTTVVDDGRDDVVGHQLVGHYTIQNGITRQKTFGVITLRTRYTVSWTSMAPSTLPRVGHRFGSFLTTVRHQRPRGNHD